MNLQEYIKVLQKTVGQYPELKNYDLIRIINHKNGKCEPFDFQECVFGMVDRKERFVSLDEMQKQGHKPSDMNAIAL